MDLTSFDIRTGKTGRLHFFMYRVGLYIGLGILGPFYVAYVPHLFISVAVYALIVVAVIYLTLVLLARRLRDIGIHPAFCLIEILAYVVPLGLFTFIFFVVGKEDAPNWAPFLFGTLNVVFVLYVVYYAVLFFKKGEESGRVDLAIRNSQERMRDREKEKLASQLKDLNEL